MLIKERNVVECEIGEYEKLVFFFDEYVLNILEDMFSVGYEIISIILRWVIVYLVNNFEC